MKQQSEFSFFFLKQKKTKTSYIHFKMKNIYTFLLFIPTIFTPTSTSSLEKIDKSSGILPLPAFDIFQNFNPSCRNSVGKYVLKATIKNPKQISKRRSIGLILVPL